MGFEVADQTRTWLVDLSADLIQVGTEILARTTVVIPIRVVKLDEPDAALDEPPSQ